MSALGHEQTIASRPRHVRYSPQSGHSSARFARPLSANSGLAECTTIWIVLGALTVPGAFDGAGGTPSYNHPPPSICLPPVASDGTHPPVFMPVSLLNAQLTQHARHRLRSVGLAKLIEKAASR